MKKFIAVVIITSFASSAIMAGPKSSIKLSSGLFYASGQSQTLGSANSEVYSVPLLLAWENKRLHASVSTSYLSINNQYPTSNRRISQSGVGDTLLSFGYDLTESPWFTLKVKHKFPTGDKAKGLSTGKSDTSLQLDYFTSLKANTSAFATVGYKFVGKATGSKMKNSGYLSAGMGYILAKNTSVGFSIDYRQSSFQALKNQLGGSVFVSQKIAEAWSVAGFGAYDNTQTTSLGLTFTRKL